MIFAINPSSISTESSIILLVSASSSSSSSSSPSSSSSSSAAATAALPPFPTKDNKNALLPSPSSPLPSSSYTVNIDANYNGRPFDPNALTGVAIDVCALKLGLNFSDPILTALTSHIGGSGGGSTEGGGGGGGGGTSILRVGGSDQNNLFYDLESSSSSSSSGSNDRFKHHATQPTTATTATSTTTKTTDCECGRRCVITADYWSSVARFAAATGHRFVFGLAPDEKNATALVAYAFAHNLSVHAYTFGNEIDSNSLFDGYRTLRELIDSLNGSSSGVAGRTSAGSMTTTTSAAAAAAAAVSKVSVPSLPLLAGPDVALQRHAPLRDALAGLDPTIIDKISWVKDFTKNVGRHLDVVSWHTYDFHANEVGTVDHHPLVPASQNTSRLWNTAYLDIAARLYGNMSDLRLQYAPQAAVWLTETDSVCHQGVDGDTNAYLNSLWLVNRLGLMAERGLPVMVRQSLIGYNYSLLGNWPVEPIHPNPDYFTTLLFQRLTATKVLKIDMTPFSSSSSFSSFTSFSSHHDDDEYYRAGAEMDGGKRKDLQGQNARAYAFCARDQSAGPGGVAVAFINFQTNASAVFSFAGPLAGKRIEYVLTPATAAATADDDTVSYPFTSRVMALNGVALRMKGPDGTVLPEMEGHAAASGTSLQILPLSVAFAVFPDAKHIAC